MSDRRATECGVCGLQATTCEAMTWTSTGKCCAYCKHVAGAAEPVDGTLRALQAQLEHDIQFYTAPAGHYPAETQVRALVGCIRSRFRAALAATPAPTGGALDAGGRVDVERLARALPYWRESNRETCLEDAAVILDRLGAPPGVPVERHRDEARQAALEEVLAKPPYAAARLSGEPVDPEAAR